MSNRPIDLAEPEFPISAPAPMSTVEHPAPVSRQDITEAFTVLPYAAVDEESLEGTSATALTRVSLPPPSLNPLTPPPVARQPSPPPSAAPQPPEETCMVCTAVLDKDKDPIVKPCRSCRSPWCKDCLKDIFVKASKDESLMPPRCCNLIHHSVVQPLLLPAEYELFKRKFEEWSTPNRIYCPVPTCSAFIPTRLFPKPAPIRSKSKKAAVEHKGARTPPVQTVIFGTGVKMDIHTPPATPPSSESESPTSLLQAVPVPCPQCNVHLCNLCKQLSHAGPCLSKEDIDPDLEAALKKWGVKRCPKCRTGVRRMHGCSHMRCRCGAQFCWYCTGPIENCREEGCDEEIESDRRDREVNGDDDEDPAPEDDAEVGDETEDPDLTDLQREERREAREAPAAARRRAALVQRTGNHDAGHDWRALGLNFGDEPNVDEQDVWACDHRWTRLVESDLHPLPDTQLECQRCFGPVHAAMQPSHDNPELAEGKYLFNLSGMKFLFDNDDDAADYDDLETRARAENERLEVMVEEQEKARRMAEEAYEKRKREEELTVGNAAWVCDGCGFLVCGDCKRDMPRNVVTGGAAEHEG